MTVGMAGLLNMSPVAAASTLGESFADRLKRLAEERKAEVVAEAEPRSSTGGITSGMDPVVNDVAQLEQDITEAGQANAVGTVPGQEGPATMPPAPSQPAQAMAAGNRGLGRRLGRPQGDMLPVPGPSKAEQAAIASNAPKAPAPFTGGVPGLGAALAPPAPEAALPPPPEAPPEPSTAPAKAAMPTESARQQAEREIGTKRTKMEKLGIALTAAAETLSGLTNRPMTGATAAAMDKRRQRIEERMSTIQGERDRLQAEIDKGIARQRGDRAEAREERQLDAQLKKIGADIAATKDDAEIKRLTLKQRERRDQLNDQFKQAQLAQKREEARLKGVTLQPGASFNQYNPETGEWVTVIENNNQMVTSTDNTTTRSMVVDGKEVKQTETTNTVQRKGASGPAPKGASGPAPVIKPEMKAFIDKLTPAEVKAQADDIINMKTLPEGMTIDEAALILQKAGYK